MSSTTKVTKSYTDFFSAGSSITLSSIYSLPANSAIVGMVIPKTAFTLPGSSFIQILITDSTGNQILSQIDATTSDPVPQDVVFFASTTNPEDIKLMFISDVALNGLTGGTMDINFIVQSFDADKRTELYSGTTNSSGNYTVTFATAFSATPNIQAQLIGGTTEQSAQVTAISTTGFTVHVFNRTTVLSVALAASTTNVNGASVNVVVREN